MEKKIRIGCGAGFWGDSPDGPRQLVRAGNIDYLVMDYLAEITMSIMTRMKAKREDLGYATDFVNAVAGPLAKELKEKGIRIVTNAGGVNLSACRDALLKNFAEQGVNLNVAIVTGDDLLDKAQTYRDQGVTEMFSGAPVPEQLSSANAYLGAFAIARALDEGADIVLTGRVVDSAVVLGPLIHEFGWTETDYDQLAMGSLAGHVVECGTQATGGIVTDWEKVEDWDNVGFPIAECMSDGSFVLTKTPDTGGWISQMGVSEQIVYEVGDPAAYLLPDVSCDFTGVTVEEIGDEQVLVSGGRGNPPTDQYKISATYMDGYRSSVTVMLAGVDAVRKAERLGDAILARTQRFITDAGFGEFSETSVEILGAESMYGAHSRARGAREIILKIAVRHPDKRALSIFGQEIFNAASSTAQGLTGFAGGRPAPQPVVRSFSFLADKTDVPVQIEVNNQIIDAPHFDAGGTVEPVRNSYSFEGTLDLGAAPQTVPLIELAYGRSGDKGDICNIGVLARKSEYLPLLAEQLTADAVKGYLSHLVKGEAERFDWPGLNGFNFMLHQALGGGGVASLRHDPQGKTMSQLIMDMPIKVPSEWISKHNLNALGQSGSSEIPQPNEAGM